MKVAEAAIHRARNTGAQDVRHHVGYWLVDKGRLDLEIELGASVGAVQRLRRLVFANPGRFYAAAIFLTGIGALILPAVYLALVGASLIGWLGAMAVTLVPASVLAITAVHWAITRTVPPTVLPKLDYRKGLPENARCFVESPHPRLQTCIACIRAYSFKCFHA